MILVYLMAGLQGAVNPQTTPVVQGGRFSDPGDEQTCPSKASASTVIDVDL